MDVRCTNWFNKITRFAAIINDLLFFWITLHSLLNQNIVIHIMYYASKFIVSLCKIPHLLSNNFFMQILIV